MGGGGPGAVPGAGCAHLPQAEPECWWWRGEKETSGGCGEGDGGEGL